MSDIKILKRLFADYSKKYLRKISLAFIFSLFLAASTSSVAYLLDPAIKELFIKKNQTLVFIIPLLIILAFAAKGASLYFAKVIMIGVAEDVRKDIQNDLLDTIINNYSNGLVKTYLGILYSKKKFIESEGDKAVESKLSYLKNLTTQISNHTDNFLCKLLIEFEIFKTNYYFKISP